MKKIGIVLIISILFISSCAASISSGTKLVNGKPSWYWKPNEIGKKGGVGVAGMHIGGRNAQRELAIERAINDIAKQLGVKVSNVLKTESVATQDSASTMMESYSIHTVDGQTVNASIREFWEDPRTRELYVWMVMD